VPVQQEISSPIYCGTRDIKIATSAFAIEGEIASLLVKVNHLLSKSDTKAYLVGGFVRDCLLRRDTSDIDIALPGPALGLAQQMATRLGGTFVLLDEENQVARVVLPEAGWHLDFSALVGVDIEADLSRRDFTINAMAVNLEQAVSGKAVLIDPWGGRLDLELGLIRMVRKDAFVQDPLRLLRAVRFAAELGFNIEPATEEMLHSQCQLISRVAGERIQEELCHLLSANCASHYLRYMDRLGLLLSIFPELASARGFEQPKEHFWDVLQHSLSTVEALEFLFRDGSWEYVKVDLLELIPWSTSLAEHFREEVGGGHQSRVLLKLAALLHDVAKPQTRTIEDTGRIRFLGHSKQGASLAAEILKRLRFSSREIKLVESVIEHHLRPGQMRGEGLPTRRAIYRYFRDAGEAAVDTLFISLADHLASRGPGLDVEQWKEHNHLVSYVLEEREREAELVRPPKLISGHDLMQFFGLQPGPELGHILEAVREAQAAGEVTSREEALSLVGRWLSRRQDYQG